MTDAGGCPICGRPDRLRLAEQLFRCRSCHLTYQDPRPSVERVRAYYDLKIYTNPSTSERIDQRRRGLFLDFLDRVPAEGRRRLLDVGCGTGEFLRLAKGRGWDAYGVELSPEAVEVANRLGLAVSLGMLRDQGETDMSFPDGWFDIVTLWNVLDLFPRPREPLREIHRVLAPDGQLFIRTPNEHFHLNAYRLSRLLRWPSSLARLSDDAYIFHSLLWSPKSLRILLETSGFRKIRFWNSPLSWGDPYQVVPQERERVVRMIKRLVYGAAQVVSGVSGTRWLLGPSLSVLARK
ncbi:MAG TPA: class I SAM-dependent methyltransferase [Methylomirabilota bacterium]|nr:class I SAM-dependent methyltransferase [Methylomirabilota bacterium]